MKARVLMVCLGNICRSPLAEGILKSKVNSENVFVDSAGTSDYHINKNPDPRSITIAKEFGVHIEEQRGRQFLEADFDNFDHIYVMDSFNKNDVLKLARNKKDIAKVKLLLNEVFPDENVDVPDPFYGGEEGFKNLYVMLDQACNIIARQLRK